jgi:hypothetical protein
MKKYLLRGAAALVFGGFIAACSHDDADYTPIVDAKLKAYQEVFVDAYGTIDPSQSWGFTMKPVNTAGEARMTRADIPAQPTFRDNLATAVTKPSKPTFSTTVPAGAHYAKDYQNYQANDVIYIDGDYATLNNPQNTEGLTIYADGTTTLDCMTNQNGTGATIVVTQGSTLTLKQVSNNLKVYLAPNATLNLPNDATFQNANAALYLSNGSQVTATNLKFTANTNILNDGGTISATSLTLDQGNTLWNEGTINVTNSLTCQNTGDKLYNASGKTITAGRYDLINNDALLYNDGTVTTTGEIKLHNSQAEIVNNGTLSGGELNMAAGGKMHNVGTTTISGNTDLTNSNSQWMNDGQYTSGSFEVDNYSKQNYNNCRLTVTGDFHLNRGEFVLNADASVVTGSFTWINTSNFWMKDRSLLKVNGTLLTRNYDMDYGFRGVGSNYAVIQANAIAIESNEQFRMSYFGNLYVDTPTHFGQWYKDAPGNNTNQPCYYYDPTVKFSFTDPADSHVTASLAPVSIPASTCSPGYGSVNPDSQTIPIDQGETNEEKITVVTTVEEYEATKLIEQGRVFCEDLGQISTNDLDFNDVVFDAYVYRTMPSTRTIIYEDGVLVKDEEVYGTPTYKTTIVLLAAGGTLQLSLAESFDVHNVLGGQPYTTIINTVEEGGETYGNTTTIHDPVVLGTDFTYTSIAEIPIRVLYGNGETLLLTAETGWAPHKILVPIGTKWCKERVDIATAYTTFKNYVTQSEEPWKDNFVSEKLFYHPKDTYQPRSTEESKVKVKTTGPTTTYRNAGTQTQTGGYQGETVLSRQLR